MAELGKSQDIEAGDGTTTVVVLAGALLNAVSQLMSKGIHPSRISEALLRTADRAQDILRTVAAPVDLGDRATLIKSATTSLNSKLVSQYSTLLAPIAVDAVMRVIDPKTATNVNLRDIRVTKKIGGTIDDTQLVDGLVFTQKVSHAAGGPSRVTGAKIGLIQFCLSAPKTNMDNQVVVSDYTQMDRVLKEEREYIRKMCVQIQKSGCNVLLIQKSILRDAVNDLALHFLARLKVLVVRDIEREDVEFICRTVGCTPIASIESFTAERLGRAELVEEVATSDEGKIVKVTGVPNPGKTVSILIRGANGLIVDEAERSLHDALCVVRSLVKCKYLCPGGGAPEIEVALRLREWAKTLTGVEMLCARTFADAFEIVPYTLAENAGLNPIQVVTELRNAHIAGAKNAGINMRKATHAQGKISDMTEKNVVGPLLVFSSAVQLACEAVVMILKIDSIVETR
jgi:T-complex protein 1 subunit delta